jgi:hypothetical protein
MLVFLDEDAAAASEHDSRLPFDDMFSIITIDMIRAADDIIATPYYAFIRARFRRPRHTIISSIRHDIFSFASFPLRLCY